MDFVPLEKLRHAGARLTAGNSGTYRSDPTAAPPQLTIAVLDPERTIYPGDYSNCDKILR